MKTHSLDEALCNTLLLVSHVGIPGPSGLNTLSVSACNLAIPQFSRNGLGRLSTLDMNAFALEIVEILETDGCTITPRSGAGPPDKIQTVPLFTCGGLARLVSVRDTSISFGSMFAGESVWYSDIRK